MTIRFLISILYAVDFFRLNRYGPRHNNCVVFQFLSGRQARSRMRPASSMRPFRATSFFPSQCDIPETKVALSAPEGTAQRHVILIRDYDLANRLEEAERQISWDRHRAGRRDGLIVAVHRRCRLQRSGEGQRNAIGSAAHR